MNAPCNKEIVVRTPYFYTLFFGLLIYTVLPEARAYFGLTSRKLLPSLGMGNHANSIEDRMDSGQLSPAQLCDMFKLHRKQLKMCKRGRGVPQILNEAMRLSVMACQKQFRYERWNCTLGQYQRNILKKGFKETSFLYAISSAGLVHSFAQACSRGISDRCTCDISKNLHNTEAWKWGSCGDNIRYGLKFTRKFLRRARRWGKDLHAKVDQHNTNIGIQLVKNKVHTRCKCYGVSGSCTTRTCWRQLASFNHISEVLKAKYENAVRVNNYDGEQVNSIGDHLPVRLTELMYVEKSPSFCRRGRYSAGVSGRVCLKGDNCKVMCCGRGYNVQNINVKTHCFCEVIWCCYVNCKVCNDIQEVHTCK